MTQVDNDCNFPTPLQGVTGSVHYQVLDAAGGQIVASGMTPYEQLSHSGMVYQAFATFSTPTTTIANGLFDDIPVGFCSSAIPPQGQDICAALITQNFQVVVGTTTYSITTVSTQWECYYGVTDSGTGNPTGKNFSFTLGNP
jgi:hypothetical protein